MAHSLWSDYNKLDDLCYCICMIYIYIYIFTECPKRLQINKSECHCTLKYLCIFHIVESGDSITYSYVWFLVICQKFIAELDIERILRIDQHLAKIEPKIKWYSFIPDRVYIEISMVFSRSSTVTFYYAMAPSTLEIYFKILFNRNLCKFNFVSLATKFLVWTVNFRTVNKFWNSISQFRTCFILWKKFHSWSTVIGQSVSIYKHRIVTLGTISHVVYICLSKVCFQFQCTHFQTKNLKVLFQNRISKINSSVKGSVTRIWLDIL